MDGLTATTPIYTLTQESAPVPADPPVIDMARLNLRDPFEQALWRMVSRYRGKKQDYTPPGESPWWNFDGTESDSNLPFNGAVMYEIGKKRRRIQALGFRDAVNEPVADSYEDMAVYAAIAFARHMFPTGEVQ